MRHEIAYELRCNWRMNFWEEPLDELNANEWEVLCDGCGRCCMHKLEDEDRGEMLYIPISPAICWIMHDVAAQIMNIGGRKCPNVWISGILRWNNTGGPEKMMEAGVSIQHFYISEDGVEETCS